MKYFNNITTAEELKKQFRAYCVNMHPDKGGDPEEFKQMMSEYNGIIHNFEHAKEEAKAEEEARQAAEESRQRAEEARKAAEERKRKEEEEARKAAEALRDVIAKWSGKLKTVTPAGSWYASPSSDYLAAVKYNIKKILGEYFQGVNFTVSLKHSRYGGGCANITWTDGPTVNQVKDVEELNYFISHYFKSDPYGDYGHDEEMKSTRAWREKYGQISANHFDFTRTFSELGKAEVLEKIYEVLPQFAGMTNRTDEAVITSTDTFHLCQFFGFWHKETGKEWQELSEEEREADSTYYRKFEVQRRVIDNLESSRHRWSDNKTYLRSVYDVFLAFYTVSEETTRAAAEAAAAPVFEAKHGRTWQAIKKALGVNVFGTLINGTHHLKEISIYEAAEMVTKGEKVYLGKPNMYDGERCIYGVNGGGAKVQQKRADKFAAVGVTISNYGYNSYKDVEILQFAANVLSELRKDAEEVEKQRKQWEEEQKNGKQTANKADRSQKAAKNEKAAEGVDMTAAPAEGLELVEIAGGVAVVGDQRTTYKNRKQIKAHGARWNKEAQQWQATTPEAVAALREWFGMTEQSEDNTEQQDATAQTAQEGAQGNEATATDEQQPASEKEQQSAADEPEADEATAADTETCEQVEAVGALASALSFLVGAIVSATEKANEALKKAAASAAEAAANFEAEHRAEERKEAAAILREQIKKVSEQVASLSDTIAQMMERLNALESGQDVSEEATEEPQTVETAQDGATAKQNEETAQDHAKGGSGSGVSLSMLRAAAEDAQRLTMSGEYKRAALAELYALCACRVDVLDLIDRIKAMSEDSEPAEVKTKCAEVRKFAANRAEVTLSPEVLRALYSHSGTEPGSNKAA